MKCAPYTLVVAVILSHAPAVLAQSAAPPTAGKRLELTSTSEQAKVEFRTAWWHAQHAFATRAVIHLERALLLDPQFGLARIFYGNLKTGLSAAQRQEEYSQGLAALVRATPAEQLLGLSWRERFSGRQPIARTVIELLQPMVPGDLDVGLDYYTLKNFGKSRDEIIANWREATTRYPAISVAWRGLGYSLFAAGDHAGGIAAMREHVRTERNHPNSHESLAEVLGNDGQFEEAIQEDQRALALDSSFNGPYAHMADMRIVQGDLPQARALWQQATAHAMSTGDTLAFAFSTGLSYLLEGAAKTAIVQLSDVARRAEPTRPAVAGGAIAQLSHQVLAGMEALYGDAAAVSGHLARAAQLGDSNTANQHAYAAFAFAAMRRLEEARQSAERFSKVANNGSAFATNVLFRHTLDGFIAMQSNDAAMATREFGQAGRNDVLAKELLAEVHVKAGQPAEAKALREEVRRAPTMIYAGAIENFWAILARQRAKEAKVS